MKNAARPLFAGVRKEEKLGNARQEGSLKDRSLKVEDGRANHALPARTCHCERQRGNRDVFLPG